MKTGVRSLQFDQMECYKWALKIKRWKIEFLFGNGRISWGHVNFQPSSYGDCESTCFSWLPMNQNMHGWRKNVQMAILVGGFNPSKKYAGQTGSFPHRYRGWKFQKNMWVATTLEIANSQMIGLTNMPNLDWRFSIQAVSFFHPQYGFV